MNKDLSDTVAAKSDQLNAADLIGGPVQILITSITITDDEKQPAIIRYKGDNGKPYKPSLSMRRLIISGWGGEKEKAIGRTLELYNDPTITFGREKTGGICVGAMSDILKDFAVTLQKSKGQYKTFLVRKLVVEPLVTVDMKQLIADGKNAAGCGTDVYKKWFLRLDVAERTAIDVNGEHQALKQIAVDFDSDNVLENEGETDD